MDASQEVAEFLRGWNARTEEVKKLQRQRFLLETTVRSLREDRKNWLEGTDNAALRLVCDNLKEQVKVLEKKNHDLHCRINALENPPKPKPVKKVVLYNTIKNHSRKDLLVIEFDGGTSCNDPRKGYGNGYGSFKVANQNIIRVQLDRMSANAAEILTAARALESVQDKSREILMRGDSQIALSWVARTTTKEEPTISVKTSEEFKKAIRELYKEAIHFPIIYTEWRGRKHSELLFGH